MEQSATAMPHAARQVHSAEQRLATLLEQAELALNAQELSFDPTMIGPALKRRESWLGRRASGALEPPVETAVVNVEMPENV